MRVWPGPQHTDTAAPECPSLLASLPVQAVYFTTAELHRLNQHLYHQIAGKLFDLIRRDHPDPTRSGVKSIFESISEKCTACRSYSATPFGIRASVPLNELVLNQEVEVAMMWLDGLRTLHVVDTDTRLLGATFLRSKSVEGIWDAFLECWCNLYLGYSTRMRVNKDSAIASNNFRVLKRDSGIELVFSGI